MKKSARRAIGVVVVLGVAWVGASWYTGKRVEQEIRQYVEQVNQQPTFGEIRITSYERGLFSSTARYALDADRLPLPEQIFEPGEEIAAIGRIEHGPFPWSALRRGQFAPVLAATHTRLENSGPAAAWFGAAKGAEPMQERSIVRYSGDVEFTLDLAPVSVTSDDTRFETDGARIQGTARDNLSAITANGSMGTLRLLGGPAAAPGASPGNVVFTGLAFEADNRRGQFVPYIGDSRVRFDRITVETEDEGEPVNVALVNYAIASHIEEDATNVSGRIEYGLDAVQINSVDLGRLNATVRFGNLNGATLKGIMARHRELMPQILRESADPQTAGEGLPPTLSQFFDESLQALLPHSPSFGLDPVRWSLPGGESSLRLNVVLQESQDESAANPWFGIVRSADAGVVISRPMAVALIRRLDQLGSGKPPSPTEEDEAEARANTTFDFVQRMLLSSGYVVREGDNLVVRMSVAGGKIRLNGEDMTLEELVGEMMGF